MGAESSPLTARELQVLEAIAGGLSCRDTAVKLAISEFTVRKHRSNMLAKLGLHSGAALVLHARNRGWLRLTSSGPGPPGRNAFSA